MATYVELIRALEDSAIREDVKAFAINALIDEALSEIGVARVSDERREKIYARFREVAARMEL